MGLLLVRSRRRSDHARKPLGKKCMPCSAAARTIVDGEGGIFLLTLELQPALSLTSSSLAGFSFSSLHLQILTCVFFLSIFSSDVDAIGLRNAAARGYSILGQPRGQPKGEGDQKNEENSSTIARQDPGPSVPRRGQALQ